MGAPSPSTTPPCGPSGDPTIRSTMSPTTISTAIQIRKVVSTPTPSAIPSAVPSTVPMTIPTVEGNEVEASIGGLNLGNKNSAASGIMRALIVVVCFFVILFCFGKKLIWKTAIQMGLIQVLENKLGVTSITSENRVIQAQIVSISNPVVELPMTRKVQAESVSGANTPKTSELGW